MNLLLDGVAGFLGGFSIACTWRAVRHWDLPDDRWNPYWLANLLLLGSKLGVFALALLGPPEWHLNARCALLGMGLLSALRIALSPGTLIPDP